MLVYLESSRNFLVTRFMCSCSLFSFAAAHFHLDGRKHFQRNQSPLLSTLALAISLLSMSMQTRKFSRKKESALLLLFLSLKVREAMRFTAETCRNVRVLEMQNFIPAYMQGWTYASRTIIEEPKFLGCIDYQIFLPMVLLYASFAHARAPLY